MNLIAKSSDGCKIALDGVDIPNVSLWEDGPDGGRLVLKSETHRVRFAQGDCWRSLTLIVSQYVEHRGWVKTKITPVILEDCCDYNRTYTFRVDPAGGAEIRMLPPPDSDSVLRELVIKATSHDMYSQQFDSNTAFQDWTNLRDYVQKQVVPAAALPPKKKFKVEIEGYDVEATSTTLLQAANRTILTVHEPKVVPDCLHNPNTVVIRITQNGRKHSYQCNPAGISLTKDTSEYMYEVVCDFGSVGVC